MDASCSLCTADSWGGSWLVTATVPHTRCVCSITVSQQCLACCWTLCPALSAHALLRAAHTLPVTLPTLQDPELTKLMMRQTMIRTMGMPAKPQSCGASRANSPMPAAQLGASRSGTPAPAEPCSSADGEAGAAVDATPAAAVDVSQQQPGDANSPQQPDAAAAMASQPGSADAGAAARPGTAAAAGASQPARGQSATRRQQLQQQRQQHASAPRPATAVAVAPVATMAARARARAAQMASATQPLAGPGPEPDLGQQLGSLSAMAAPQRADMPQVDTFTSKVSCRLLQAMSLRCW